MQPVLIPTILSGGAGSRLWPVSREKHPKPFIRLPDGESLLQKAFLRGARLPDVAEVLTVTNRDLLFKTEDEFSHVNQASMPTRFILEPLARNTAPAIACAALDLSQRYGEEAVMLVLAADHLIQAQAAFAQAVSAAVRAAQSGKLVAFGIRPDVPETGYGYVEIGELLAAGDAAMPATHAVQRFVEKPSLEKAREYLSSGRFFWNSGMFCFRVGTLLETMQGCCPEVLQAARLTLTASKADGHATTLHLDATRFAECPDISFDYAVMEKAKQVALVEAGFDWSDVGSWTALGDLMPPDAQGNRVQGQARLVESADNTVQGSDRLIGVVGVNNLVIIDTPDALLVANKASTQNVKHIYAELKAEGHEAHRDHRTVQRPWGSYTVLEEKPGFKVKRIEVKPGAHLSLQLHHRRSEHWVVVQGVATVLNGTEQLTLLPNQSTFIPVGTQHRLSNLGTTTVALIEVQCGDYLGEDDIVRLQDNYGRV